MLYFFFDGAARAQLISDGSGVEENGGHGYAADGVDHQ